MHHINKSYKSPVFTLLRFRTVLTVAMMALMLWLVNINYCVYNQDELAESLSSLVMEDFSENPSASSASSANPAGPDEKSPNAPFSFSEEYLHEDDLIIAGHFFNEIYLHKIYQSSLIDLYHYELLSPPPERC